MSKILVGQSNFTAGELTPRLYGHIDLKIYDNGLYTAQNCTAIPHGPIIRRNGTKFIGQAKSVLDTGNSRSVKLVRFQFSADDAFILEFGEPESSTPYIRFYTDGGQVLNSSVAISGITQASPAVVTTSTAHGLTIGDNVYITDVLGMTEVNRPNKPYQVGIVGSPTTFQLREIGGATVNSTAYTAYSSGGIVEEIYEIASPYSYTDLDTLSYVQYGNIVYFAHPSYPPKQLTRRSSNNWVLENIFFNPPPTYEPGYKPATTVTPGAVTGFSINFTAGAATWVSADVGRQIINETADQTGKAVITSVTSPTVAVCDIIEDFTNTTPIVSQSWKLDLSPIAQLKFSGYSNGSVITVNSLYPADRLGTAKNISGITKATPAAVSCTSHGFSSGDKVKITDVLGMTEINNRTFIITVTSANGFTLADGEGTGVAFNSSLFNTYTSAGKVAKVFENIAQNAFRSTDVGNFILANDGVLEIIGYTSATEITCLVLKSLSSQDVTENWSMEAEDWTADRGYPRCVGLYQERLVFGSTDSNPVTLYMSEVGIFDGFGIGTAASDAIIIDISSQQVNQINWISNSRDLVIGTAGSEVTIRAPSAATGLSSTNIDVQTRTYHGSLPQIPINVGNETLFVQGSSRKVRTFRYDFNIDGYTGEDLLFYAEHLTEGGIKEIAYAQEPDSTVYAVTNNGDLLVGTYVREQQIIGWTKCISTNGDFENVQVISEGNVDQVWVVIKRVISGITYRYLELFDRSTGEDRVDIFSDCTLQYSAPKTITNITEANPAVVTAAAHGFSNGDRIKIIDVEGMTEVNGLSYLVTNKTTNTFELETLRSVDVDSTNYSTYTSGGEVHKLVNTISGLEYLNGETVQVKVDGATHADCVVDTGSIELDNYHYEVTVGLEYETNITTLAKDFDVGQGPMQGQRSRYVQPILRVYKSTYPLIDGNFTPSRSDLDQMDEAVPLHTGDIFYGKMNWSNNGQLSITCSDPLPLQISGIFGSFEGNVK